MEELDKKSKGIQESPIKVRFGAHVLVHQRLQLITSEKTSGADSTKGEEVKEVRLNLCTPPSIVGCLFAAFRAEPLLWLQLKASSIQ